MTFPSDFHPIIIDHRTYFHCGYRVPWGARTLKNEAGQPKVFKTHSEATIEACMAAMNEFRDRTTGWNETPLCAAKNEIERVFGGKPS